MTRSSPNSSPGSDKESDTDSHLDQFSAISVEESSGTSHGSIEECWPTLPVKTVQMSPCQTVPFITLASQQFRRLTAVLNSMVIINEGSGFDQALPTFACRPIDFLGVLLRNLRYAQIQVDSVRLYGGAASYVLSEASSFFNDIDLMITVTFDPTTEHLHLDRIKSAVLKSLREIVREVLLKWCSWQTTTLSDGALTRAYIGKLYKHNSRDDAGNSNIWSLFSFNNFQGRNIEFKFIHTMQRQYKFSIDSWQIDVSTMIREQQGHKLDGVRCYCLFPCIETALEDLDKKRIRVSNPGEVRGGCFLRYGDLLHRLYNGSSVANKELTMLERFLTDFYSLSEQNEALEGYLQSHMSACSLSYKIGYLKLLNDLVDRLSDSIESRDLSCAACTLLSVIKAKTKELNRVWRFSTEVGLHSITMGRIAAPSELCNMQEWSFTRHWGVQIKYLQFNDMTNDIPTV